MPTKQSHDTRFIIQYDNFSARRAQRKNYLLEEHAKTVKKKMEREHVRAQEELNHERRMLEAELESIRDVKAPSGKALFRFQQERKQSVHDVCLHIVYCYLKRQDKNKKMWTRSINAGTLAERPVRTPDNFEFIRRSFPEVLTVSEEEIPWKDKVLADIYECGRSAHYLKCFSTRNKALGIQTGTYPSYQPVNVKFWKTLESDSYSTLSVDSASTDYNAYSPSFMSGYSHLYTPPSGTSLHIPNAACAEGTHTEVISRPAKQSNTNANKESSVSDTVNIPLSDSSIKFNKLSKITFEDQTENTDTSGQSLTVPTVVSVSPDSKNKAGDKDPPKPRGYATMNQFKKLSSQVKSHVKEKYVSGRKKSSGVRSEELPDKPNSLDGRYETLSADTPEFQILLTAAVQEARLRLSREENELDSKEKGDRNFKDPGLPVEISAHKPASLPKLKSSSLVSDKGKKPIDFSKGKKSPDDLPILATQSRDGSATNKRRDSFKDFLIKHKAHSMPDALLKRTTSSSTSAKDAAQHRQKRLMAHYSADNPQNMSSRAVEQAKTRSLHESRKKSKQDKHIEKLKLHSLHANRSSMQENFLSKIKCLPDHPLEQGPPQLPKIKVHLADQGTSEHGQNFRSNNNLIK